MDDEAFDVGRCLDVLRELISEDLNFVNDRARGGVEQPENGVRLVETERGQRLLKSVRICRPVAQRSAA